MVLATMPTTGVVALPDERPVYLFQQDAPASETQPVRRNRLDDLAQAIVLLELLRCRGSPAASHRRELILAKGSYLLFRTLVHASLSPSQ